jgi:hypothetical protein
MMTESIELAAPQRRVRVWFGAHPIADHVADAEQAAQYEAAMRRRFASLRVTSEPVFDHSGVEALTSLPAAG